jgi:hypothetical protein
MCIFSVKTTKLTPCCALVRESTLTVREYGFPSSRRSLVPNQGWCFSSFKQKLLPFCEPPWKNQLITDLSVRLSGSTTFIDRCTSCQKIVLATHIPNELPILPDLLELFVSAQIIILQSSAWFLKNCTTWANNAWSKLPSHIDTLGFAHGQ